jgi:hypothetical protein
MMPPSIQRQTFIALRARRQAYQIATQIMHPPLKPYQFFCRHCGAGLDALGLDVNDHIRCDDCGLRTRLPPGCASELRRMHQSASPSAERPASVADVALWCYLMLLIMLILFSAA